ncbi:probable protein phosphatase 2C 4 [Mercurialis annua]|uniref:probable protein phosphatase 2C 4 n=1 Tax=Mercurialis annua TaxID=3986 RepID=UPI00216060D0|nr:probable protein phosphatase 2C 4 [Mercurialis annua]
MGNKLTVCFTGESRRRQENKTVFFSDPLDEGLGHSFCYVRPDPTTRISSSKVHSSEEETTAATAATATTFRSISGASVSANTSTPLSTAFIDPYVYNTIDRAAAFESSTSFASIPLQPIPRNLIGSSFNSGPLIPGYGFTIPGSGPLERGFMSGPIERGFMSGPLDPGLFSAPLEKGHYDSNNHSNGNNNMSQFKRSYSHGGFALKPRSVKRSLIQVLQRAISKTLLSRGQNSVVTPIKNGVKDQDWIFSQEKQHQLHNENTVNSSLNLSSEGSLLLDDDDSSIDFHHNNLQWAQGKAGEDRVHVVVSEEHGWVFVGIYDGFNGPDAPDFLSTNLYSAVHKELKGLLWDDDDQFVESVKLSAPASSPVRSGGANSIDSRFGTCENDNCLRCLDQENHPCVSQDGNSDSGFKRRRSRNSRGKYRGAAKKWEENQMKWKCEWDRERLELDRRLKEQLNLSRARSDDRAINHADVLKALSLALKKTEESYLDITDRMLMENPELALMGSCVLVMLMKGEDVYLMNVGDSRAVLGQKAEPDYGLGKSRQDLERISEETLHDLESYECERLSSIANLNASQLTVDHSTNVEEEVHRIKKEHPDDASALLNDRVKGSLKVTRAFGAGFLKQPKWNDALLEMFRIDYVGVSPYLNCLPYLRHHRLGPKDRFLILSSDGLYQYLTNEEAVNEVELFITLQPEGDPAQHLVEEVLFRAAKKAGMDFHELLEVPQGDRRRYHDDVSIIVISLEGRIWRSCV